MAGYILHHVSDSPEYEFEIPLSNNHVPIHLPQILIPLKAGACTPQMTEHGEVIPGLGAGCLDLSITKHTVMMWLAALLLIGSLLIWSNRDKTKLVPRGTGGQPLRDARPLRARRAGHQEHRQGGGPALHALPAHRVLLHPLHEPAGPVPLDGERHGQHRRHLRPGRLHLRRHADRRHPRRGPRRLPGPPDRRRATGRCGPS